MLVQHYRRKFPGGQLHLYTVTWVMRGTVRVKCIAPPTQHNVPGQGTNKDHSIQKRVNVHQPRGHHLSTQKYMPYIQQYMAYVQQYMAYVQQYMTYVQQYMYNLFNYNEIA